MQEIEKKFRVSLGCDPELFLRNDGGFIVGSRSVIGDGLTAPLGKVVPDGVQVELNPVSRYCREELIMSIASCLSTLKRNFDGQLDISRTVQLSYDEFLDLPDTCKMFGCKPSYNVNSKKPSVMKLDPSEYLIRSGAGHIHLGSEDVDGIRMLQDVHRIVPVLDIILGNTCVLLDRDKGNVERRKYYGLAGEYRLPKYGIEYRTLSNFWLLNPILASLVFGLARLACDIVYNDLDTELLGMVSYGDVVTAINENDYDMAMETWKIVSQFLTGVIDWEENEMSEFYYPIDTNNLDKFNYMVETGIDKLFPANFYSQWANYSDNGRIGFYEFSQEL